MVIIGEESFNRIGLGYSLISNFLIYKFMMIIVGEKSFSTYLIGKFNVHFFNVNILVLKPI
jgi:hypothetical protein